MQELASVEYQSTRSPEELAHDLNWWVTMAITPPSWLKMTEAQTADLNTIFVNMLEALNVTKRCGCEPIQIEAYLLRRSGLSLRKTARQLREKHKISISHVTVKDYCESVNRYSVDLLASIAD